MPKKNLNDSKKSNYTFRQRIQSQTEWLAGWWDNCDKLFSSKVSSVHRNYLLIRKFRELALFNIQLSFEFYVECNIRNLILDFL